MLHDLLLDIVHKWRISDIILIGILAFTFIFSWSIILTLGFNILKTKTQLKYIIPGALLNSFFALFIKPFIPGVISFFIIPIPPILFLKRYGKTKWVIACWVAFLLLLSSTIFPLLFAGPNPALRLFFSTNKWSLPVISLLEALGAAFILALLKIYNIPLIPNPDRSRKSTDFIDTFIIFVLLFWCYRSTMKIWESPIHFLFMPSIEWVISTGGVIAFYLRIVNDQKRDEKKDLEYQELNKKYQNLINISDPNIPDFGDLLDTHFTPREQDILTLLAQGMDNEAIAQKLYLALGTVSNCISKIKEKLGLENRDKIVLFALAWVSRNKK